MQEFHSLCKCCTVEHIAGLLANKEAGVTHNHGHAKMTGAAGTSYQRLSASSQYLLLASTRTVVELMNHILHCRKQYASLSSGQAILQQAGNDGLDKAVVTTVLASTDCSLVDQTAGLAFPEVQAASAETWPSTYDFASQAMLVYLWLEEGPMQSADAVVCKPAQELLYDIMQLLAALLLGMAPLQCPNEPGKAVLCVRRL